MYLKDQKALDNYLVDAGLKDARLANDEGLQQAGSDLKETVELSITLSRLIASMARSEGAKSVIEQAAIAGVLNAAMLDNKEAAAYLATRLDALAPELERGGKAAVKMPQKASKSLCAVSCAALKSVM